MEAIEDQIEVLESLSYDQIADFLKKIDSWPNYAKDFMKWYQDGDIETMAKNPYGFPTRNPWVIDRRDSIFCEKMQPYLSAGQAAVFVGVPHIPGVSRMLSEKGYILDQDLGQELAQS
jgi:uncharacterized protein YbaP (TraB family)